MRTNTSDDHNTPTFTGTYEECHAEAEAALLRIAQFPKRLLRGREPIVNSHGQHCGYNGSMHSHHGEAYQ